MARSHHTPRFELLEEALSILFCRVDDTYASLNPGASDYESLKKLSGSEVITLSLFQQLRCIESERSFLRDCVARLRTLLLAPVPRRRGLASLLVPSPPEDCLVLSWSISTVHRE